MEIEYKIQDFYDNVESLYHIKRILSSIINAENKLTSSPRTGADVASNPGAGPDP